MDIEDLKIATVTLLKQMDAWRDNDLPQFNTRKICVRTMPLATRVKEHVGSPDSVQAIAAQMTKMAKLEDPDLTWGIHAHKTKMAEYLGGMHEFISLDEHGWSLPPSMTS